MPPPHKFLAGIKLSGVRGYLVTRFGLLLVVAGLILIGFGYYKFSNSAERIFDDRVAAIYFQIMHETAESLNSSTVIPLRALSQGILNTAQTPEERLVILPVISTLLVGSPLLYSIFVGYENGDLFMVVHLDTEEKRAVYSAPAETSFVAVNITNPAAGFRAEYIFYDQELNEVSRKRETSASITGFDPRVRQWYMKAMSEF